MKIKGLLLAIFALSYGSLGYAQAIELHLVQQEFKTCKGNKNVGKAFAIKDDSPKVLYYRIELKDKGDIGGYLHPGQTRNFSCSTLGGLERVVSVSWGTNAKCAAHHNNCYFKRKKCGVSMNPELFSHSANSVTVKYKTFNMKWTTWSCFLTRYTHRF